MIILDMTSLLIAENDTVVTVDGAKGTPEPVMMYDEPEAAVLLVACGIGLATGMCCVLYSCAGRPAAAWHHSMLSHKT